MATADTMRDEADYLLQVYKRSPVCFVRGEGSYLFDDHGEKYLDFSSGIAVNALGHGHPAVLAAIREQSAKLLHVSNLYYSEPSVNLGKKLVHETKSFSSRAFFCNSGTEANEAALKFARKWGRSRNPDKINFVSFEHSFHGRSMGSLSVTAKPKIRDPFLPLLENVKFAAATIDDVRSALTSDVCAVITEPIQGEGGVYVFTDEFLRDVRKVCNERDVLLIFDEVQCGLGRSGKFWAHEWSGVAPDILTMAKPAGGGLPLGATLVNEKVAATVEAGDHGTTFGGNPLVCAVGLAVCNVLSDAKFLETVLRSGEILGQGLLKLKEKHPAQIKELRGRGLMWGIDTEETAGTLIERALTKEKLVILSAGEKTLRILPPLNVEHAEIEEFLQRLERVVRGEAMIPGPVSKRTPLPKGFTASGVNCGVRRDRPDVGLIVSEPAATAAGVFTKSTVKAAPVLYCQQILPSAEIKGLITNSGQSNAATGPAGIEDNLHLVQTTAKALGCKANQVLIASTGVIGVRIDMNKVGASISDLLQNRGDVADPFALAILTTDLVPKTVHTTTKLSGGDVQITGIAKGSGMIHPNMATMLAYLLTDVILNPSDAQAFLKEAADRSFNMISVDGDTSTNDSVFLLANGASGVALKNDDDTKNFKDALIRMAEFLAKSIARDGEGATKLIEVTVRGAPDLAWAKHAARSITMSPLIKSAVHGQDPNWGRVLARLGREGISAECLSKLELTLQGYLVMKDGMPVPFEKPSLRGELRKELVSIVVDLHSGSHEAIAWGCDLTKQYVEINAEYTT